MHNVLNFNSGHVWMVCDYQDLFDFFVHNIKEENDF